MVRVRVKKSMKVNRPVRAVFDYLANFQLHGEWDQDFKNYQGPEGPVELGTVFVKREIDETIAGGPMGSAVVKSLKVATRSVTCVDRDRRLEYVIEGENAWSHRVEYFEFEPTLEGTLIIKGTDLIYPSISKNPLLLLALLVPVVWPIILMNLLFLPPTVMGLWQDHAGKLRRIKARLEASF